MRKSLLYLVSIFLLSFSFTGNAQNMYQIAKQNGVLTAYMDANCRTYFKYYSLFKYGKVRSLTDDECNAVIMAPEVIISNAATESILRGIYTKKQAEALIAKYKAELQANRKLMSAKEKAEEAEKARQQAEAQRRHAIEARYDNCSVGRFEKQLCNALTEWSQKGEFEKEEAYQQRLRETAESVLRENTIRLLDYEVSAEPVRYNADAEMYQFELTLAWHTRYASTLIEVPLDVERARAVKENEMMTRLTDCVIGVDKDTFKIQSWRLQIGHDYGVSDKTSVADFIVCGNAILPEVEAMKGVQFNYSAYMRSAMEERDKMLRAIADYNERKVHEVERVNDEIKVSPYYKALKSITSTEEFLASYEPQVFTERNELIDIMAYYNRIKSDSSQLSAAPYITRIKEYVRDHNADMYASALFEEHPDSLPIFEKEYLEYRCHYSTLGKYVVAIEKGTLNTLQRDCRFIKWAEYNEYYESREEFDADYDKGEEVLKEHKKREQYWKQYRKYYADRASFDADYSTGTGSLATRKREIDARLEVINQYAQSDLKGALEGSNQVAREVAFCFVNLAAAPAFQEEAAELLVLQNKKIAKEYEKNGQYFASKAEFVMAYISSDYKNILKSKK